MTILARLRNLIDARRLARQMRENHGITLVRANELADELKSGNAKWPRQASVTAFVRKRDRAVAR